MIKIYKPRLKNYEDIVSFLGMQEDPDGRYVLLSDVKEYLRDYQMMAGLELVECEDD